MTTTDKAIKQLRQYRARAQRMKLICGLLAIALVAVLITTIVQSCQKATLEEEHEQLQELMDKTFEEKRSKDEEIQVVLKSAEGIAATYIGDYTITYYCACEQCCDSYGVDRPLVDNTPVVFTSTGEFAQEGITVAVDPEVIPYGSLLYIDGVGYRIAQDCGGAIQGNRIDVYMDTHEEAIQMGIHEAKVYTITGGITNDNN